KLIDGDYYLVMQSGEKRLQMLMTITQKEVKQVPISGEVNGSYIYEFFHATRMPRLFFVLSSTSENVPSVIYQLDESGASKKLFQVEALTSWKEKLLVFDRSGMTLYKVGEQGLTSVYQVKGRIKKMLRDGGTHENRLVVYKKDSAFFMLDLENDNDPVRLDIKYPPFYYLEREGRYFLLHRNPQEIVISEVRDGKILKAATWQPQIEFEYGQIWVSAYGVMVFNEQEYEVYPFKK
ncbi:MAG: hypothetical protein L0Y73_01590, partial [Candidatus Aminicenantes bacterium]|nr:hypothetical protein [Candidatus Aminicenantes bacterium]